MAKNLFGDNIPDFEQRDRAYQRKLMQVRRKAERDIKIDYSRQDLKRRRRCRNKPDRFCLEYFPEIFFNPFTKDQDIITKAIKQRIQYGGKQAIAAERGGGKTSITKVVGGVWAIVYGWIDWIVLVRATGEDSKTMLKEIKSYYEFNNRLAADFPEICDPIRALEGAPQRAKSQTVNGVRTRMEWAGTEIVFPTVKGSKASGSIITAKSIDGAIRGLVRKAKRPEFVLADDIETRQSAISMTDTKNRRETLDKDVAGLAGPGEDMATVLLCTVINRRSIGWEYTDIKKRPEYNGIRQCWIKVMPKNRDMWDRYVDMVQTDLINGDKFARTAFAYYRKNRRAMDKGAVVSNPERYIKTKLPGGKPIELSSLQSAFNIIARTSWEDFCCEYQNEPPDESLSETSGLTPRTVAQCCNGLDRGVIPGGAEFVTAGIDIHGRLFYYIVVAWKQGFIGHIMDYGTNPVYSPTSGKLTDEKNQPAVQVAIHNSLMVWRDWVMGDPYKSETGGEARTVDLSCIDAGWMDDAIYKFVKSNVGKKYRAVKGFGSSQPQAKTYHSPSSASNTVQLGHNWYAKYQPQDRVWLFHVHSDYWKQIVQNAFLTDTGKPGSMSIFGDDPYKHRTFGRHICSEEWTKEFMPGKGTKEFFNVIDRNNHWLDCLHYAAAAASMCGCWMLGQGNGKKTKISLAKIQQMRRSQT